jgi:hypothetical protein
MSGESKPATAGVVEGEKLTSLISQLNDQLSSEIRSSRQSLRKSAMDDVHAKLESQLNDMTLSDILIGSDSRATMYDHLRKSAEDIPEEKATKEATEKEQAIVQTRIDTELNEELKKEDNDYHNSNHSLRNFNNAQRSNNEEKLLDSLSISSSLISLQRRNNRLSERINDQLNDASVKEKTVRNGSQASLRNKSKTNQTSNKPASNDQSSSNDNEKSCVCSVL